MPLHGRKKVKDSIDKMVEKKNKQVRAVFIQTMNDIVYRTPIDSGRAKQGWIMSMGSPDLKGKGGREMAESLKMPKVVLGKTVYFANGVDYIETLEAGRRGNKGSFQAPNGMVRIALRNAQKRLRKL